MRQRATNFSPLDRRENGAGDAVSPAGSSASAPDQDENWVRSVQTRLMDWYREARRDLPWRADRDPYRILVSEMMLVQTTVTAVIPYFERFLSQFPDAGALAAAAESDVLKAWEGLGYYRRARQLQAAARTIVREHGGTIPDDPRGGARPAGRGPLHRRRDPVVCVRSTRADRRGQQSARAGAAAGDQRRPQDGLDSGAYLASGRSDWCPPQVRERSTRRLMELGALVCTPREPACLVCPLSALCEARRLGLQDRLPIVTPRPQPLAVTEAVRSSSAPGRVLIVQRGRGGLWEQFWEFPTDSPGRCRSGGQVVRRASRPGRGSQAPDRDRGSDRARRSRPLSTASPTTASN